MEQTGAAALLSLTARIGRRVLSSKPHQETKKPGRSKEWSLATVLGVGISMKTQRLSYIILLHRKYAENTYKIYRFYFIFQVSAKKAIHSHFNEKLAKQVSSSREIAKKFFLV